MEGGRFGHSFASAGITELAMPMIDEIGHPLAEATAASLFNGSLTAATGGKFANGAATAAMSYAFNQLAHHHLSADGGGGETAEDRMLESVEYDPNKALAYQSIGTFYLEQAQKDFLAGRIDATELNAVYRAQASGVVAGAALALTSYGAYQAGTYGAAGVAFV
jgi:hypothetical protein